MMESSIADTTTASRSTAKNEDQFHNLIKVRFTDETGAYRSLVTADSHINLRLSKLENGNILRIEVCSPDHDSLVFRRDLTERSFKDDQYFANQELTFDFKSVYQIVVNFVRAMATNKDSFIRCCVRKTSSKSVCELGLVSASMTSKPSFRLLLEALSGSQLIEYLEKINDSTKKRYNKLLDKYRLLKNLEKQVAEMEKQIEDFKLKEQKHWTEKTQHQKQELALMGIAKENEELKDQINQYKAEIKDLYNKRDQSKRNYEHNFDRLQDDYETLARELEQATGLIESMKRAHHETKKERDQLRKDRDRFQAEIERLRKKQTVESQVIQNSTELGKL